MRHVVFVPAEQLLHQHFESVYGDRWPGLWHAMQQPTRHAALVNPFAKVHAEEEGWQQSGPILPDRRKSVKAKHSMKSVYKRQPHPPSILQEPPPGGSTGPGGSQEDFADADTATTCLSRCTGQH
eukprot:1148647-Pelagomonas_calceolata.AAC.3